MPDGAKFTVAYSAEKQEWSGTLDIPDAGLFALFAEAASSGEAASGVFRGSASGVFRLLTKLDAEYRAFKVSNPNTAGLPRWPAAL